jgi:hypothetical protein
MNLDCRHIGPVEEFTAMPKKRDPPEQLEHPSQAGAAEVRFPEDDFIRTARPRFRILTRYHDDPKWIREGDGTKHRYTQAEALVITDQEATQGKALAKAKAKAAAYYGQE